MITEFDNEKKYEFYRELEKASFKSVTASNNTRHIPHPGIFWYPLAEIKDNVPAVAYNHDFFDDNVDKLETLKGIFDAHNIISVTVVPESNAMYKEDWQIDNAYDIWDYLFRSEQFVYDDSHTWLIYSSHEATITFAGEWLVKEIIDCFGESNKCKRFYAKR